MISQETLLERISDQVAKSVRLAVLESLQREFSSTITRTMVESEFLRRMNDEMRTGLLGIYQKISFASGGEEPEKAVDGDRTQKLFSDATKQIEEIMRTTLQATEKIMETVEDLLVLQEKTGHIIASLEVSARNEDALARLDAMREATVSSLTNIITDLSFQDLTGQRLKKVVKALASIRETVFDLYVSTGLMMKTREETPEKDLAEIAEESRRKVEEIKNSELKGPTLDASQKEVDDLLASLGL